MNTHRNTYPEQYAHPRVGENVEVVQNGKIVAGGIIERVISTRFGQLALFEGKSADVAWLLSSCKHAN